MSEALLTNPLELPDVFLKYQQELMTSISHNAVVVWEKSRRTGFSWAVAAEAVLTASATRAAGGQDVFYLGYNLEMAREFIDYVGEWAKELSGAAVEVDEEIFHDADHPEKDIKAFRVTFASGFKVLALPSVPRSLRGMQGLVIIDEAAFHDDLPGVLKAAFALLIWGGKVVVLSTHNGDSNPFNVLVQDIRAGRLPYHLGRTTFDEALADGLYKRICLTTGKEWSPEAEVAWRQEIIAIYGANADEELFVVPGQGSGTYLSGAVIEKQMRKEIPVIRLDLRDSFKLMPEHLRVIEIKDFCEAELLPVLKKLDPKTPHAFGDDFGRIRDLSVFWPLAIGRDLVLRTPFVLEMRNVPYEAQRQIIFYIVDRLPMFRAGKFDATGNGGYLAEVAMQRYGERIEAVMLNEGWYRENMPRWKAQFDDGMIEIPMDRDIGDDHRLVKLIRGVGRIPDERTGEKDKKRHGDSAVASALAVAASRAEPEIYGYQPAKKPGSDSGGRAWRDTPDNSDDDFEATPERGWMPEFRGGMF
jgi:phage FluMu gp28-like protein